MATHSSVLAWRIPGTGEPGGLPSVGSRRVGHDRSDLAAAAAVCVSRSVMFDSMRSHGLQPARLLCPWNSPGKNTGVGSHSLLQGSNPGLLHYRQILDCRSRQGSPRWPPFNTIILATGDMTSPQKCWRTQTSSG